MNCLCTMNTANLRGWWATNGSIKLQSRRGRASQIAIFWLQLIAMQSIATHPWSRAIMMESRKECTSVQIGVRCSILYKWKCVWIWDILSFSFESYLGEGWARKTRSAHEAYLSSLAQGLLRAVLTKPDWQPDWVIELYIGLCLDLIYDGVSVTER